MSQHMKGQNFSTRAVPSILNGAHRDPKY